jgi:hypothetical protein
MISEQSISGEAAERGEAVHSPVYALSHSISSHRHQSLLMRLSLPMDSFFIIQVATYLYAVDLLSVSRISKHFNAISKQPLIWQYYAYRDFQLPISKPNVLQNNTKKGPQSGGKKETDENITIQQQYMNHYQQYKQKILNNKTETIDVEYEVKRVALSQYVGNLIDISQFRLATPTVFASIFLSITLFCQKVDGLNIPYWSCAIPATIGCLYVIFSFIMIKKIHDENYNSKSIFKGMFDELAGPLVYTYKDSYYYSSESMWYTIIMISLTILQLLFLIIKLSSFIPMSTREDFSWGLVFLPMWIYRVVFWYSFFQLDEDEPEEEGLWYAMLIGFWIPFVIFFICLTIKLEYNDDGKGHIRLVYMLIPFFLIEGMILLVGLYSTGVSIIR